MAVRGTRTQDLKRTANLPDDVSFTICGWARMVVDANDFCGIVCIDSGSNPSQYALIETAADGTQLHVTTDGATAGNIAVLDTTTDFFWALKSSGTAGANTVAYYRTASANTFTTASPTGTRGAMTPTQVTVMGSGFGDAFGERFNGRVWNVKCWDRALTDAELLIESYYERVKFPANINFHWLLPNLSNTADMSGNGRNATVTGTLTTEDGSHGLWRPRRRIFIPAAAAGGAITGDVPLTLSVTSTLTGAGALAGTVPLAITPTGALTGAGALSGSVALAMTPAGDLTGAGALAGSVGLSFGVTGDLTSQDAGAITGSVPASLAVTGELTGTGALVGAIQMDLTASGVFQAAAQETFGGGFIVDFEREQIRRAKERRKRRELEEESEQIEDKTTREIAALLREQEAKDERRAELARLSDLVASASKRGDETALSPRVQKAIRTAAAKQTAWALFQLEREMHRAQEEEQFLLQALSIAVHYYE